MSTTIGSEDASNLVDGNAGGGGGDGGEGSSGQKLYKGKPRPPRRARHWRKKGSNASASGSFVDGSSMAGSLMSGVGSQRSSFDRGSGTKPPVSSPSLGPVPGYAYTGMG